MKKIVLISAIVSSTLLIIGGTFFAIGIVNETKNNKIVTNEYEINDFNDINVDIDTADLEFKVSNDGSKKVVCVEKEKQLHSVEVDNNTLIIESNDERKWYERIFNFNLTKTKVTIYMPLGSYDDINIKSSTGNVYIPNQYTFSSLNIEVSTGNIQVQADVLNSVTIESSTGNVSIETESKSVNVNVSTGNVLMTNSIIEENIEVTTSTGQITINDTSSKMIRLKTSTGDIKLTNVIADDSLFVRTSTGNVRFTDCDATKLIDIETSTGNVNGSLLTGKIFDARTSTGKINCPPSNGEGLCKVRTSTGNINITLKS